MAIREIAILSMTREKLIGALALAAMAALSRLIPHPPNMAGMTAAALVGGKHLGSTVAVTCIWASTLFTDLLIGLYDWRLMAAVYGSYALVALGAPLLLRRRGVLPLLVGAVGGATAFFLITNVAVWLFSPWYDKTLEGLVLCFTLALPFFKNSLAGTLLYTACFAAAFAALPRLYRFVHARVRYAKKSAAVW